jgi:1-acyl-sn-glycerol-3-phosphate acyltransferase
LENIPSGKPVIIAPNHTNAFVDPTILAMMLRQEVYFFARSDVFNTSLKRWFMARGIQRSEKKRQDI